jgi:hypothetical protein
MGVEYCLGGNTGEALSGRRNEEKEMLVLEIKILEN